LGLLLRQQPRKWGKTSYHFSNYGTYDAWQWSYAKWSRYCKKVRGSLNFSKSTANFVYEEWLLWSTVCMFLLFSYFWSTTWNVFHTAD